MKTLMILLLGTMLSAEVRMSYTVQDASYFECILVTGDLKYQSTKVYRGFGNSINNAKKVARKGCKSDRNKICKMKKCYGAIK